jgi:hypothetical protein
MDDRAKGVLVRQLDEVRLRRRVDALQNRIDG